MKRTILVICGNRSMNYILRTVLEGNYDLIAVTDVYDGMTQLRLRPEISLVIVDTDFQQKECLELIGFLKSSFLHNKPVFALSSLKGEALAQLSKNANAEQVLVKPFNPADLVEKLDLHFVKEMADEEKIF
ncbi:MAG: hypothetical protein IAE96_09380 [Chitinophagaceae bacterium]|nr:hypothetical protein [Chitinophagaceae bacterium]